MPAEPLCGPHGEGGYGGMSTGAKTTRSVEDGIPTQSVGTKSAPLRSVAGILATVS